MSPAWLIVCASFLFATMGVCVKLAAAEYPTGEIVFYRSLTGVVLMLALARWQRGTVATTRAGDALLAQRLGRRLARASGSTPSATCRWPPR